MTNGPVTQRITDRRPGLMARPFGEGRTMLDKSVATTKSFSSRDLRDALSSFATGVTIVTGVDGKGDPVGMTVSSFNSVSMEPPLVLWSVTKTALSAPAFKDAKNFAVHVLASDQMDLSNRFAKSGQDKFEGLNIQFNDSGIPVLDGALTRFDCRMWATYEGGDHWIIVGEVESMVSQSGEGLVFCGGSYATASSIRGAAMTTDEDNGPIESLLIYNLARAHTQMGANFHEAVAEAGLSVPQWRILASLFGMKTRTLADMVRRTFVSPRKLHNLLQDMHAEGLLTFTEADGRGSVSGTLAGQKRVEHLFELGKKQEEEALAGAASGELEQLLVVLKRIIAQT